MLTLNFSDSNIKLSINNSFKNINKNSIYNLLWLLYKYKNYIVYIILLDFLIGVYNLYIIVFAGMPILTGGGYSLKQKH